MKRWKVGLALLIALLFTLLQKTSANSGAPPLSYTNAPGEQNCTVCHNSLPLNGSGLGDISITGLAEEYMPGATYSGKIFLQDTEASDWSFELTVLDDNGQRAGTLAVTDSVNTELRSNPVNGASRDYLTPTIAGNFAGLTNHVNWQFNWTAPPQSVGAITFYLIGVAANGDNTPQGDRVYSFSTALKLYQPKPPSFNFLTPTHGSPDGNTSVTIYGDNFDPGVKVTFDDLDANAQLINTTTLMVTTPAHFPGSVDVTISNPSGLNITAPQAYTYDQPPPPAPQLVFVDPGSGPTTGGTTVKINGTNFVAASQVVWDGKPLPTTFINTNFLMIATPLHDPGVISIQVVNPDGQSAFLKDCFTYEGSVPPPVIKLLSPSGGEVLSAGGAPTTITWTINSDGTAVQRLLLSTDSGATFPIVLADQLDATVNHFDWAPSTDIVSNNARLRLEAAQPSIVVDSDSKDFKILAAPQLDAVSPATTKSGKTRLDLSIDGSGFVKGTIVEMDGVKLKTTVISDSSIKVKKAPHSAPGSHFIQVRTPDGAVSLSYLFTVAQ